MSGFNENSRFLIFQKFQRKFPKVWDIFRYDLDLKLFFLGNKWYSFLSFVANSVFCKTEWNNFLNYVICIETFKTFEKIFIKPPKGLYQQIRGWKTLSGWFKVIYVKTSRTCMSADVRLSDDVLFENRGWLR